MTDVLLILVILAEMVFMAFLQKKHEDKENKLINALLAKNPQELADLQIADKLPKQPDFVPDPDLVSESQLSDEEFDKLVINATQNG